MFYKNLFKSVACIAILILMTSCGGLKTKEVILDDCIKIPAQSIKLAVNDYSDEEETDIDLESTITIEALKDSHGTVYMKLYDKDDVELIKLIGDELPKDAGQKKKCNFGLSWLEEKTKEELNDIIQQTDHVKFESNLSKD